MQNYSKRVLAALLLTVSIIVSFGTPGLAKDCAWENQKDPILMAADVTLARPVGAMATVAGFAIFAA